MEEHEIRWEVTDAATAPKRHEWYWTVAIVALGVAVAAIIVGNILFAVIALIGAFAIMLAASRPTVTRVCAIRQRGIKIGTDLIPYANVRCFAIKDENPIHLILETTGLMGIVSVPLTGADHRAVRMALKNQNVEEADELHPFSEKVAKFLGI